MKKTLYLLDTSALAAHFLHAPGDEAVGICLEEGAAVSALTAIELAAVLRRVGVPPDTIERAWMLYREVLADVVAIDEPVAALAIRLQRESAERLPLADACVAASAVHRGLHLYHCDRHFEALPASVRHTDIRRRH